MTTAVNRADRFSNRAPKGGAVSPINGLFYRGGQFMPMAPAEFKPGLPALDGSTAQVLWASRLRREELARLDAELARVVGLLDAATRREAAAARAEARRLAVARHGLMAERSASAVIDRRAAAIA